MLGLERVLSEKPPRLASGAELRRHQVDALAGMLTELIAAVQKSENGNGHANGNGDEPPPEDDDEPEDEAQPGPVRAEQPGGPPHVAAPDHRRIPLPGRRVDT